jgi:catechol 2,3-dioxygenase-like lactoylglutathione lyase family enzyme
VSIRKLAHYSIRARDLEASCRFYTEVLNFRVGFRPAFSFPGVWLYLDRDESELGLVHLIGSDADDAGGLAEYLGHRSTAAGTGVLDHVAFLAERWPEQRTRCERLGVHYVERAVPGLGLHQVFLSDPSGVVVELNYRR